MVSKYKGKGWHGQSFRHSQASKGIKTVKPIDFQQELMFNPVTFDVPSPPPKQSLREKATESLQKFGQEHKVEAGFIQRGLQKEKELAVGVARGTGNVAKGILSTIAEGLSQSDPQHISQAPLPDQDKDGVPDKSDWDVDNDGVPNWEDSEGIFGIDSYHGEGVFDPFYENQKDTDSDGVPDFQDLNPRNPFKSRDFSKKNGRIKLENMSFKECKNIQEAYKKIRGTKGSIIGDRIKACKRAEKHFEMIKK